MRISRRIWGHARVSKRRGRGCRRRIVLVRHMPLRAAAHPLRIVSPALPRRSVSNHRPASWLPTAQAGREAPQCQQTKRPVVDMNPFGPPTPVPPLEAEAHSTAYRTHCLAASCSAALCDPGLQAQTRRQRSRGHAASRPWPGHSGSRAPDRSSHATLRSHRMAHATLVAVCGEADAVLRSRSQLRAHTDQAGSAVLHR